MAEITEQPISLINQEPEGIKTPFNIDTNRKSLYEEVDLIRNQPYTNWETFKHSAKQMYQDTTLGVMQRKADIDNARRTEDFLGRPIHNKLLTKEQANARYQQYGVSFNSDIRENEAEVIAAKKIREYALRQRLQQTEGNFLSGASSLMGAFAGAMLDPVNIATAFIPVTRLIPALKTVEAMGAFGRIATKGLDGLIMNSLVEPAPLWMAGIDQRDYSMSDSLFNVVAGGVFGAGMGAFTEGVRALSHGELFNTNLAASIDFANNRGVENVTEFQAKKPSNTSFSYDDLVELPDSKLLVTQEGKNTIVRLSDSGPLTDVVGIGRDVISAKENLRAQLGNLLEKDSIASGYRLDDSLDRLFEEIKMSNEIASFRWMSKYIADTTKKANKAGISFEEYLAKQTDNFKNFDKVLKAGKTAQLKQAKYSGFHGKAIGDLAESELDDLIEEGAEEINAMAQLKAALAASPRQKPNYELFIGDLRERVSTEKQKYNDYLTMTDNALRMRVELERLNKQLDVAEDIAERENLTQQINSLNTSISTNEFDMAKFLSENDIDTWRHNANNVDFLERLHTKLTEEPRTFEDMVEQLKRHTANEEGNAWDTSDSILDDMSMEESIPGDEAHIQKLQDEIDVATQDIKAALESTKFTREDFEALGINKEGQSVEMRRADQQIEQMKNLTEDAEHFAECRRTEII